MKKAIFTFCFGLCACILFAQAPEKINYQAVARNAQGQLLLNKTIKIRASILNGSAIGTSQYSETHSGIITNAQTGAFSISIGGGVLVAGSGAFSAITWEGGTKYLKIEMDPANGNNFVLVGTSQLLSVPYALYAKNTPTRNDSIAIVEFTNDGNENCTPKVAGAWNKRCLNLVSQNNISGFDFNNASDIITLQPGRYLVSAFGTANYCEGNVLRFKNTLSTSNVIYGTSNFSRADLIDGENDFSFLEGIITVTVANSQYVLEHWIKTVPALNNQPRVFGHWPNTPVSIPNTWARIVIQKIK